MKGVRWFTNFDHKKRHQELVLYEKFRSRDYRKYDNYDAIEVGRTVEIPKDYDGAMGVPISFIDKYNPDQLEIIDLVAGKTGSDVLRTKVYENTTLNGACVLKENGRLVKKYARILIRRK